MENVTAIRMENLVVNGEVVEVPATQTSVGIEGAKSTQEVTGVELHSSLTGHQHIQEDHVSQEPEEQFIPPADKIAVYAEKFQAVITNPRFWSNPKRVDRLDEALNIPEYDDRSLQQFFNSAMEELKAEAIQYAIENNCVPIMPTREQGRVRAEAKHAAKLAGEKAKVERQAQKLRKLQEQLSSVM